MKIANINQKELSSIHEKMTSTRRPVMQHIKDCKPDVFLSDLINGTN